MPLYRYQVSIAMASGNPKDSAQNVWHAICTDETAALVFATWLNTFYTSIDGVYSNLVATTGHRVKVYDLADPEPRAPVIDDPLGAFTVGGAPLPTEVAYCVSFEAPRQSGQPQQSRRGRIYVGPLAASMVGSDGRPSSAFMTTVGDAIDALLTSSQGSADQSWAVYSRKNEVAIEVTDAWIDNEFDTQRRRGRAATSRTTF